MVSFVLCFLIAESLQGVAQAGWVQSFDLSFPAMILGGIVLAIASNYRRSPPNQAIAPEAQSHQQDGPGINPAKAKGGEQGQESPSSAAKTPSTQSLSSLPSAVTPPGHRSQGSISFEIHRRRPQA
ncbi:hypothetical protein [Halomicronema hongdechloris]|uniref:hypothetical protein n=1 Tax=Halomicronema hongdechloris TaxID=1209493 RepID=UPI0016512D7C|nr:hypothetical protein [Halomicronema hongdechloris]